MMVYSDRRLIQWIVADQQDRSGTKDKYQFIALHRLRENKCLFITVDGKVRTSDDMMAFIEGGLGAETSEKVQKTKSLRVLTGTKPGRGGKPKRIYSTRRLKGYPDGRTEVFEGYRSFP